MTGSLSAQPAGPVAGCVGGCRGRPLTHRIIVNLNDLVRIAVLDKKNYSHLWRESGELKQQTLRVKLQYLLHLHTWRRIEDDKWNVIAKGEKGAGMNLSCHCPPTDQSSDIQTLLLNSSQAVSSAPSADRGVCQSCDPDSLEPIWGGQTSQQGVPAKQTRSLRDIVSAKASLVTQMLRRTVAINMTNKSNSPNKVDIIKQEVVLMQELCHPHLMNQYICNEQTSAQPSHCVSILIITSIMEVRPAEGIVVLTMSLVSENTWYKSWKYWVKLVSNKPKKSMLLTKLRWGDWEDERGRAERLQGGADVSDREQGLDPRWVKERPRPHWWT